MKISKFNHYIPKINSEKNQPSLFLANRLAVELLNYGIQVDKEIVSRISRFPVNDATKLCKDISEEYSVGALNPPLFKKWESRTSFTIDQFVVQIFGYIFQISGKDLVDDEFMDRVVNGVDFNKFKKLRLASDSEVSSYVNNLFGAEVSLDKKGSQNLIKAAEFLDLKFLKKIKSDEARIAAVLGASKNYGLEASLAGLECKPADVLRFSAAKNDFELVKLPDRVKYSSLKWRERIALLKFLESFSFDYLSEALGMNRDAWDRFFKHIHLANQPDFIRRFPNTCLTYYVASRCKLEAIPVGFHSSIKALVSDNIVETTDEGSLVYRTFASRMQTAIEQKNISAIEKLGNQRKGYVLRNLSTVANGIYKADQIRFTKFVRSLLTSASVDVLFSILSIDITAKYRIIDIKGDTRVEDADYSPVIGSIQEDIKAELYRRFGFEGKVKVKKSLQDNIVPFLAKNTNLARGSRYSLEDKQFLYLYVHWVQGQQRTDIDHSFTCFDSNWNSEVVYFGRQANDYLSQSGDITNAPAPSGATEYGCLKIAKIPKKIKYIVPLINSFTGNVFKDNTSVRAGFFCSDESSFTLRRDHISYNLDQPALGNIPFVLDVDKKEVLVLDVNSRESLGRTVHGYEETIRKVIEASKTKNYITIQKLADILSGEKDEISLTITNKPEEGSQEIAPESLFSLFSDKI